MVPVTLVAARFCGALGRPATVVKEPVRVSLVPTAVLVAMRTWYVVPGAKPERFIEVDVDAVCGTALQVVPSREVSMT